MVEATNKIGPGQFSGMLVLVTVGQGILDAVFLVLITIVYPSSVQKSSVHFAVSSAHVSVQ